MYASFKYFIVWIWMLHLSLTDVFAFCSMEYDSSSTNTMSYSLSSKKRSIGIVGGGLAGLSVAYHLLIKSSSRYSEEVKITIMDQSDKPGEMGASSVAGGLLHPFTPRGKLVHMGKEGLEISNKLLIEASKYEPNCILRDRIFRAALSSKHVQQLNATAKLYPEFAISLSAKEIQEMCGAVSLGGVKLSNGCKVVHVPSYLKGLFKACQNLSEEISWIQVEASNNSEFLSMISKFDTVILSAGSGIISEILPPSSSLPVTLVRGQSVELTVNEKDISHPLEAVLCGKYVTPLTSGTKMLIGATHEYKKEVMSDKEVMRDLFERSNDLAPTIWKVGNMSRITSGWRVQSERGAYGRIPIVGRLKETTLHNDAWIFTGLGSRGLIHHGIYGEVLSDAILANNEISIFEKIPHARWWQDK